MVRRGGERVLEGVWDLAKAELSWRDRVRPLSGDGEGIGQYLIWKYLDEIEIDPLVLCTSQAKLPRKVRLEA